MNELNPKKLEAFLGKAVVDLGAAMSAVLINIGDRLGLYRALAEKPMTSVELAAATSTAERYVREWLCNQAASGYVDYDPSNDRFSLNPEQRACLTDPNGPVDLPGAYEIVRDLFYVADRTLENFKSGAGMEWGEHHRCLFHGTERFFRSSYHAHLLHSWLPALEGVVPKLERGARVADVGCGHGASTILMAQAFPKSRFIGVDYHAPSIEVARERARDAGVHNAEFEVAEAALFPERDFDLIAFFDCLHDMGDPGAAARHAREALKPDGHCLIVEPFAGDAIAENLTPVGRVSYGASSMICVPVSLARNGPALGAQAGEKRIREVVVDQGGFKQFRRAAQTLFNLVLEARP